MAHIKLCFFPWSLEPIRCTLFWIIHCVTVLRIRLLIGLAEAAAMDLSKDQEL